MNNYGYLGVVRGAVFQILVAEDGAHGAFRLTTVTVGAGSPPEHGEIPLEANEDQALLVRGIVRGTWIYAATIVEKAGPILTMTAEALFSAGTPSGTYKFPGGLEIGRISR
jgi:hypothetical protein